MMMKTEKRKIARFIAAVVLLSVFVSSSCGKRAGEEVSETFAVTFVQDGFADETRVWKDGVIDVPTPKPVKGYDVCWDAEDIGNTIVTEAIVVNIRKTPKIYNAVFKVEGKTENKRIAYREKLAFPIIDDEAFICWQVENDAAKRFYGDEITYDYACDTTFIAVFRFVDVEIIVDGNYTLGGGFSPNLKIRYGAAFNEYLGYNFGNYAIAKYTYVMNGKTITITQSGKEVCRSDGKITLYATVEVWTDFY